MLFLVYSRSGGILYCFSQQIDTKMRENLPPL